MIPLNPKILKWARVSQGYTPSDVAQKLKLKTVTEQTICYWEEGKGSPTYSQLEALAYKIYKRPLALFFFPDPPEEDTPQQSFRTLSSGSISQLDSNMRYLLRQAMVMKLNLAELYDDQTPSDNFILSKYRYNHDVSISSMIYDIRKYFDVDIKKQNKARSSVEMFKIWRTAFEEKGIFVFKEAFKNDFFSGFCLYDNKFPIIYINNSMPFTRQIFTLFHELAHLLFGIGGIDTRYNSPIEGLSADNKNIEIKCNRFAGEFLVPTSDFIKESSRKEVNEKTIEKLSQYFNVSREVILRKYLDNNQISKSYYNEMVNKWSLQKDKNRGRSGGDYYLTKGSYLGEKYLNRVFSKYYKKQITSSELAGFINIKIKNITKMEQYVLRKGFST